MEEDEGRGVGVLEEDVEVRERRLPLLVRGRWGRGSKVTKGR